MNSYFTPTTDDDEMAKRNGDTVALKRNAKIKTIRKTLIANA